MPGKPSLLIFLLLSAQAAFSQHNTAVVSGKVLDENENPMPRVNVVILGRESGIVTTDSGTFQLRIPAGKAFALLFSFSGYKPQQRNFLMNENERERITIRMERDVKELTSVVVTDNSNRKEAGLIRINPKDAINIPSPVGGIESMIKVFVGTNNELTSQYSVRGGNYDENLIYINDFELFRPYLVGNAQQEGLSFINPEMTRNVNFYTGGFQARYGDKLSSVLDIQYKKPKKFGGSAYMGLLEQGLELEGATRDQRFTWLVGARNRNNRNILASQETRGNYIPSSSDLQGLFTWQAGRRNSLELFTAVSSTRFTLIPQSAQLTSSVFSPYLTANLGLDVFFNGQEKDRYQTNFAGLSWNQQISRHLRFKWMASRFEDNEVQNSDITGDYLFGERDFDKSSSAFGQITNPLGAGTYQDFSRDRLNIVVYSLMHKGSLELGKHFLQWGAGYDRQEVSDHLHEWERQDSAGYSIPNDPGGPLRMYSSLDGAHAFAIDRFSGFVQDNMVFGKNSQFTMHEGVRVNYNNLNHEWLVSPRAGFSWKPKSKKDIIYRGAFGIYDQPPFYRELRRPDGSLDSALRAQKSWQAVAGLDINFHVNEKPFRFTAEAYYKHLWDVNPYDINNVRITYFGTNNAHAYAMGVEGRLFANLVKDAESWVSIGFMRTREKIDGATYYDYTLDSLNRPVDSTLHQQGWVRRPTDRLFTLGMFIQDYLSTNQNFKVYLNLIYGSNLPFNIPGSVKYRNALTIDPYIRADIGFSALLLDADKSKRRSHNPFRKLDNIWLTLEVFNLIDRDNTISYLLIKDFSNTVYAMPQRLTPRLLNLKLVTRF